MSNSNPAPSRRAGLWDLLRVVGTGGLSVGLILAVVQCRNERENARFATVQTYNLGRIASFRDTGAELDKRVALFNDAAAEGKDLKEPRLAVRNALIDHGVKTFALRDDVGASAYSQYTQSLRNLQSEIEATIDEKNAGSILTAMSDLLVQRELIAKSLTKKAIE